MVGCVAIAEDEVQDSVWHGSDGESLTYIGVDAQYFSAILIPQKQNGEDVWFATSQPLRVGKVDPKIKKITDVTCRLRSVPAELSPGGEPLEHSFKIFDTEDS